MAKKFYLKIILFSLIIFFFGILFDKEININKQNLNDNKVQELNLLLPSKECINYPKTLYFQSQFEKFKIKNNSKNIKVKKLKMNRYLKTNSVILHANMMRYKLNLLKSYGIVIDNNLNTTYSSFFSSFTSQRLKNIKKNLGVNKYQKFFFFKELKNFFTKDILYKNYKVMQMKFKNDYNFMTETLYYPEDKNIIEKKFKNYKFDKNNLWLIKPTNKNSGEGIIIFTSLKEIKLDKYIINKYLTNLDLIDNRKYDLRIYALIIGVNPLRLYIYKNGFVRRCTKEYSLDINSINDKNIHLTNTHINIAKKEYIHPKHPEDENATIWSLITYKKYLKKKNVDVELLDEKIKDIIIKTIISFYSKILNEIEKNNIKNLNFFDLLGFDILLTNNYEPKLLEVNTTPSPFFYNDLMKIIKTNLFIDELNLIGVVPFYHGQNLKMLNQKFDFKNYIDFRINEAICEINRPKGDFDLIFPLKQNIEKYKKFFPHLTKINIKFWEKILQN